MFFACWLCLAQGESTESVADEIEKLQASGKNVPEAKRKELLADLQVSQSCYPVHGMHDFLISVALVLLVYSPNAY